MDGFPARGLTQCGHGEEPVRDRLPATGIPQAHDQSAGVKFVQQAPDFLVQELAVVVLVLGALETGSRRKAAPELDMMDCQSMSSTLRSSCMASNLERITAKRGAAGPMMFIRFPVARQHLPARNELRRARPARPDAPFEHGNREVVQRA